MAKKSNGGITKKEAVRKALEALGRDAKPAQLQPYIKQTFGIDMTPGHITTAKGEILRGKGQGAQAKAGAAPKPQAPATAPEPPARQPARAPAGASGAGGGGGSGRISLEDLQTVKGLLGRVGADTLRTLIDLLAE